jgi:serine/threonine protein kinase
LLDALNVPPGTIFAGKYRVERVLGEGGMGVVLGARHIRLDERVAIKLLLPELASMPPLVARFLREARAAAKVRGEHVVRVHDVDIEPQRRIPYIVMEHLEGENLAEALAHAGVLPVATAVDWVQQACEALAEAHALGIVHRDLKPGNLFLATKPDGSRFVKVLDFGISKIEAMSPGEESLTDVRHPLGTPLYMAPEQLKAASDVDARADIWALGIILYELVEGQRPFADLGQCVLGQVRPLRTAPHRDFVNVVMRCLRVSPSDRFESVADLARSLVPFGEARANERAERIEKVLAKRFDLEHTLVVGPPPMTPPPVSSSEVTTQRRKDDRSTTFDTLGNAETDPAPPRPMAPAPVALPDTLGAVSSKPTVAEPPQIAVRPVRRPERRLVAILAGLGILAGATTVVLVMRSAQHETPKGMTSDRTTANTVGQPEAIPASATSSAPTISETPTTTPLAPTVAPQLNTSALVAPAPSIMKPIVRPPSGPSVIPVSPPKKKKSDEDI